VDKDGAILRIDQIYVHEKIGSILIKKSAYTGNNHWTGWGTTKIEDWIHYYKNAIKIDKTIHPDQHLASAIQLFSTFDEWRPITAGNPDETALVASGTKARIIAMKETAENQMEKVETIRRLVKAKVQEMYSVVSGLRDQIKAITKVLGVFELYLGIHEKIVQIGDGDYAPIDMPITIHQAVLYMDEETGIITWRNGQQGIDYQRIGEFDEWVIPNIDRILPEQKGVILLRPTRQHRKYSSDPFQNSFLNANNHMSYILIRNGQKVYRIWTGTALGSRFIPGPDEIEQLFLKAEEGSQFDQKRAKDQEFKYRKHALLLQGLLDRTDIFKPILHLVSLGKPETYGGLVNWVYDDEPSITDGLHVPYLEWHKEINSHIQRGTRVLVVYPFWKSKKDFAYRFKRYYSYEGNCPPHPQTGIYTIDHEGEHQWATLRKSVSAYYIMYNPEDEIYGNWYQEIHKRKNRVSFALFKKDPFVLNYDRIVLSDIEHYIDCRYERINYLEMLPVLMDIRDQRLKELEWEKHFVGLVAHRTGVEEGLIWKAVEWWKNKVIWKRPIRKDDAKALRMVEKRVKQ